jgi:hypothetical protein
MTNQFPRIISLKYKIDSEPSHQYSENAKFSGALSQFACTIESRDATFTPSTHFETEIEARKALEPQLRAWEIAAMLSHGVGVMTFRFVSANVEEGPSVPGIAQMRGYASLTFSVGPATLTAIHNLIPQPLQSFALDDCVETLSEYYMRMQRYPEALLSHAYAMMTCVANAHGTRDAAAAALAIDPLVFKRLNSMASQLGVGSEARKHERDALKRSPRPDERIWMAKILREVLLRSGAFAAKSAPSVVLTLANSNAPSWEGTN